MLLLFYLTTGKFLVGDAISERNFIILGAKRLPKFRRYFDSETSND